MRNFCLQPKINIPELLSASKITDLINASDSESTLDEDEPDNADLRYVGSEMLLNDF
jgi:hypothetical protein